MRAKSMALLMLALGCGLVASIGITQVMAKRNVEPVQTGETQQIVVAIKDISLQEKLSSDNVKLEAWPKDKVPQGSVSKIEDIEGCRTRTKLYSGEPILEKKLFGKGVSLQGDSILIPKGFRAVAVKIENSGAGLGLITPGDRVDVLVHLTRNPSQDIQETSTRTILQDIKVFAVNDVVDVEKDKDATKDKEKCGAKTISLLVTPAQAAKLTLASELGKCRVVIRSPEDDTNSLDASANPPELFGDAKNKSEREKEKLYTEKAEPKNTALADFLNGFKKQLAASAKKVVPTATAMPTETWTMRILKPNTIDDLVFEAEIGPQAAKMPQGAWHVSSTNTTSLSGSSTSNSSGGSNANVNKQPLPQAANPTANPAKVPLAPATQPANPPAEQPSGGNAGADPNPNLSSPNNEPNNQIPKDPFADPLSDSAPESPQKTIEGAN